MRMKKVVISFLILFTFLFISVGLGFITKQVFNGSEIKTTTELKYTCPNIDISTEYKLVVPIPNSPTGETTVTPVYKKKSGDLTITNVLPASTNLVGKLAIDLNTNELNMVKGALILLWIIFLVVTVGFVKFTSKKL